MISSNVCTFFQQLKKEMKGKKPRISILFSTIYHIFCAIYFVFISANPSVGLYMVFVAHQKKKKKIRGFKIHKSPLMHFQFVRQIPPPPLFLSRPFFSLTADQSIFATLHLCVAVAKIFAKFAQIMLKMMRKAK